MARSVKKGPFVDDHLMKKAMAVREGTSKNAVVKTWSRRSTVIPDFVGMRFAIHNGKEFVPVYVTENMVGHKFGEFSPTRIFKGHTPADKKAATTAAAPAAGPVAGAAPAAPAPAAATAPSAPAKKA